MYTKRQIKRYFAFVWCYAASGKPEAIKNHRHNKTTTRRRQTKTQRTRQRRNKI